MNYIYLIRLCKGYVSMEKIVVWKQQHIRLIAIKYKKYDTDTEIRYV